MKAVWQDCMFLTQICLICDGKANLYQMYQVSREETFRVLASY